MGLNTKDEVPEERWHGLWATYEVRFEKAKREHDMNSLLGTWHDAIEEIMRDEKTKNI